VGWFGVLAESDSQEDAFTVSECHLNWWVLPTILPGRRLFFFDVGLQISAPNTKELRAVTVVLPVDVERVRWDGAEPTWAQDLFDALHTRDTSSQVFGERVEVHDTATGYRVVFPDGNHLDVVRTLVGQVAPPNGSGTSRSDLSIWTIPFESAIPRGEKRYVRFRVSVFTSGTVWQWKLVWLGKAGAQVDLRISDVREAFRKEGERQYWGRVMPIEQINVFFMVPPKLQARVVSPALRYVRLLEAGQWAIYLRGARYRGRARGLRVYYWRHSPGQAGGSGILPAHSAPPLMTPGSDTLSQAAAVTIDDPFRVFLDLNRDVSTPRWVAAAQTVLAVLVAIGLVDLLRRLSSLHPGWPHHDLGMLVEWTLGASVLAACGALARYVSIIKSRFRAARLVLRRLEWNILKLFTSG
jgi:hypothetical protein